MTASGMAQPLEKQLRIAVLNRLFKPTAGGAERYSIALVEQLAARHDIHVFAQAIEHRFPGVSYHSVSTPCKRPRWVNQLWFALATWWLTRQGFDVVHSHENTWHGQVQTVHVLPIKYNLFRDRTGLGWLLRCLKVATSPRLLVYLALERARYRPQPGKCVVVTGPGLRDVMAASYPLSARFTEVVTPGVSDVPGPASEGEQAAARVQLGLPTAGPIILFVGNDYSKKGLPALLQAMQSLPTNTSLAVVGNADQIGTFRPRVAGLGLQERVHFLGALRDVGPAYRASDCLAHPTLEDTFGMVVLEAMAHGLPVVVSVARFCGIAELLSDGVNACLLDDPRNASSMAEALQRVLPPSALGPQLRLAGQAFARKHLWSALACEQEAIYLRVATELAAHEPSAR
jgi:UDP-glucose:(heptosyl)LPS alpha-1,3-glucosyltransferase